MVGKRRARVRDPLNGHNGGTVEYGANDIAPGDTGTITKITKKMDEILERLGKIEGTQSRVADMTDSGSSTNGGSSVGPGNITPVVGQRSGPIYLIDTAVEKPTFTTETGNPVRFLRRLERYIKGVSGEDRALEIAVSCVRGQARRIVEFASEQWVTYDDFATGLLKLFWGAKEQEIAKKRLFDSSWDPNGNLSMEGYFVDIVDLVRDLKSPFDEEEIINQIMRHYPQSVQTVWFARAEPADFEIAFEFIRRLEKNVIGRTHKIDVRRTRGEQLDNKSQPGGFRYHGLHNSHGSGLNSAHMAGTNKSTNRAGRRDCGTHSNARRINTVTFVRGTGSGEEGKSVQSAGDEQQEN